VTEALPRIYPDVALLEYDRMYPDGTGIRAIFSAIKSSIGSRPAMADDVFLADPMIRAAVLARHPAAEALLFERTMLYNWCASARCLVWLRSERRARLESTPWSSRRADVGSMPGCLYILAEGSGIGVPGPGPGTLPLAGILLDFAPRRLRKHWMATTAVGRLLAGPEDEAKPAVSFYVLSVLAPVGRMMGNMVYGTVCLPDDDDARLDEAWLDSELRPYMFDGQMRGTAKAALRLGLNAVHLIQHPPHAVSRRCVKGRPLWEVK